MLVGSAEKTGTKCSQNMEAMIIGTCGFNQSPTIKTTVTGWWSVASDMISQMPRALC
jgi:hypothetical protein